MTTMQRIIRYVAIGLAILIIVAMASAILFALNMFSDFLGLTEEARSSIFDDRTEYVDANRKQYFDIEQISNLDISIANSKLVIKSGNEFTLETDSDDIETYQYGNKLEILQKEYNVFVSKNEDKTVTLTIPSNIKFNNLEIETGIGTIEIDEIFAKELKLVTGVGKATIKNARITDNTKIECGTGDVQIANSQLNNLTYNAGIGNNELSVLLTGNNKINAGVGNIKLNLTNGIENYTIRAGKGLGAITINGNKILENTEYGEGETRLKIDGGVGNIEIN